MEVSLPTRSSVKRFYITRVNTGSAESDWRYFDELRSILEFDLNQAGRVHILPFNQDLEELIEWPNVRQQFKLESWKHQKVHVVLAIEAASKQLTITAFDIEAGSSKKYPALSLTGKLENDRRNIHHFADALQKDLLGCEGVSSLRILYALREKNKEPEGLPWVSEIWICDADGENARQITRTNGYCMSPLFLPKTKEDAEFIYVYNGEGQSKILKSCLSKLEASPIISLRGNQALPAVSQNGKEIAFISDAAGRPDLFMQTFDTKQAMIGKARQLFSSARATQASPTFSPDGKRVAFVSDKDGPPRIYVMDINDPRETKRPRPFLLTIKNRENTSPAWSPDGKKLAYAAKVDGIRQIWLYDFDSEEEIPLTTGPETKENPAWAPDSLHLIYNTETEERSELFLIHVNNKTPVQISKGPGQKRFPCWETRQSPKGFKSDKTSSVRP